MDALTRAEISPARSLAVAMSSLFSLDSDSEDDVDSEVASDDSWNNMTEAERTQFLPERDMFVNQECARLACLLEKEESNVGPAYHVGGSLEPEGWESDEDPEDDWFQSALADLEPSVDSPETCEPDWVQQLRAVTEGSVGDSENEAGVSDWST